MEDESKTKEQLVTKEVGKNTSVGLYLCYRIVENLGGTLEVGSEVGKGTTFTIKLPV